MNVYFIQLTNVLHRPDGAIEEPIVICIEQIQWFKSNRIKMLNDEVVVKEDSNEIWRKIEMATGKKGGR